MRLHGSAVVVVLAAGLVLPGCLFFLDPPQRFPATYENESDQTVVFQIRIFNEDADRTSLANWTLGPQESLVRQWRLTTHDTYVINVTVTPVDAHAPAGSVEDWTKACAMHEVSVVWDGSELELDVSRGDGFAGC